MANWLEDLTKTVADEKIGRRAALRRVGGTVAGVALAGAIPALALAKVKCTVGGTCSNLSNFVQCPGQSNANCICFTDITGRPVCACNTFCSGDWPCYRNTDCPRGAACVVSTGCNCGTSSGVCIAKCKGKNKNCQLGSGRGLTATGRVL